MKKYVQFSDSTNAVIITVFGSPQDPEYWDNLGEVEDDDPRYIEFMSKMTPP